MTHLERLNESYKNFYVSYYDYLDERYNLENGKFELTEDDSKWVVEKIKDDPCRDILFQCMNDIVVEIFGKLDSYYSNTNSATEIQTRIAAIKRNYPKRKNHIK